MSAQLAPLEFERLATPAGLGLGAIPATPPPLPAPALVTPRSRPLSLARLVPDFDAPPPDRLAAPGPDPAAEAATALEARLGEARAEAFAAGEAEGRAAAARTHAAERATEEAAAIAAAAAALEHLVGTTDALVGEAATGLARLLLAALDAALPAAAQRLAPDTALLLAATIRPALEQLGRATLHVPPGVGAAVAACLPEDPRLVVAEDPAIPPGDARAAWKGGEAVSDLAERRRALAETMAVLGLGAGSADQISIGEHDA